VLLSACTLLTSCTSSTLAVEEIHSKNYSQRIKFLIMHYTGKNYQESVGELVNKGNTSSHYLIPESHDKTYADDDLNVLKLVDEDEQAWHVGKSYWQGRREINDQSIGIEMINVPECERLPKTKMASDQKQMCFFPDYDPKQIELLIELSKEILVNNPDISPTNVIGHSDVSPQLKNDPGPRFPWYQLYQAGIGAWYEKETVSKYWQLLDQQMPNIALVQQALNTYGYSIIETGELDNQTQAVLHAFQMHFLPWKITDRADEQTIATLFALLEKYHPKKMKTLLIRYRKELSPVSKPQSFVTKNGQIDQIFPQQNRSNRELVNDRAIFKSYRDQGQIIIDNQDVKSADIYINGDMISIAEPLQAYNSYQYSLKKRTKNGDNTFRIDNILPAGSRLNVTISYPNLIDESVKYQKSFAKVDALINGDVEHGFPGAVLVVVKQGKIIKNSAYGYRRKFADGGELLDSPVEMSTETVFDIASNTKMFATNFALMKLASEGKLDVSKPINHYLPSYRGAGRDLRTVKDILTHNAGYAPEVKFFTKESKLGADFFSQNTKRTKQLILTKVPFEVPVENKPACPATPFSE